MGIRYFAFPLPADVAESAADSPQDYFRSRIRFAGDPNDDRPELEPHLDLDKAWGYLQGLFRSPDNGPWEEKGRPAFELVRGQVEQTDYGWKSFVRVLTASQVRTIAADLSTIDECEVMTAFDAGRPPDEIDSERYASDVTYTIEYLHTATAFVKDLAQRGLGMAYSIG